ncbi:MAG: ribonuclease P protein component [Candidatus Azotimanducaceae bacterium]
MTVTTFPRSARLLHAQQFTEVFRKGRFLRRKGNVRIRSFESTYDSARLGVIVPKKGNRLAVRRNRIKRIVRDEFRMTRHRLVSTDIIVHVTGPIEDAELVALLRQNFERLATGENR